jgi:hypothetical protein
MPHYSNSADFRWKTMKAAALDGPDPDPKDTKPKGFSP